jgi:hypothetical protein
MYLSLFCQDNKRMYCIGASMVTGSFKRLTDCYRRGRAATDDVGQHGLRVEWRRPQGPVLRGGGRSPRR